MIGMILLNTFWAGVWNVIKWILVGCGVLGICSGIALKLNDDDNAGLAFAIMGFIPCLFWAIIPYWNVCQWILLAGVLAVHIIADLYNFELLSKILGLVLLVWTFVLLIVDLIIPFWTVTRWICLAVVFILICIGIYELTLPYIRGKQKDRRTRLVAEFRKNVPGLPLQDYSIFDRDSERQAKKYLKQIKKLNMELDAMQPGSVEAWQIKKQIFQLKLESFYHISLRGESQENLALYEAFVQPYRKALMYGNYSLLRKDSEEKTILANGETASAETIFKLEHELLDCKVSDYSSRLSSIKRRDTSGLLGFTSNSKLAKQTQDLANLANDAVSEGEELQRCNIALSDELIKVRMCAYRNIYLCTELLNYLRDGAGGQNLATSKDVVTIPTNILRTIELNLPSISIDFNNICDMAQRGFSVAMNSMRSIGINPGRKSTVALGALSIFGAGIMEHTSKVLANREKQEEIVKELNRIIPEIQKGQAGLLRSLEIIQAIIKANNGVMKIYVPLREKVFVTGQPITEEDLQKLTIATQEYKNISTTTL